MYLIHEYSFFNIVSAVRPIAYISLISKQSNNIIKTCFPISHSSLFGLRLGRSSIENFLHKFQVIQKITFSIHRSRCVTFIHIPTHLIQRGKLCQFFNKRLNTHSLFVYQRGGLSSRMADTRMCQPFLLILISQLTSPGGPCGTAPDAP